MNLSQDRLRFSSLYLTRFAASFGFMTVLTSLPDYIEALGVTGMTVGLFIVALELAITAGILPLSWADDRFSKRIAHCEDSDSEQANRLNQKKSARCTHYFHTLSKHIVQRCVDERGGTIVIGDLSGIREDEENGESKNWGKHGNFDLHSWAFNRFTDLLTDKAEMEDITVEEVSERDTSKSCSCCGRKRDANRVERGL